MNVNPSFKAYIEGAYDYDPTKVIIAKVKYRKELRHDLEKYIMSLTEQTSRLVELYNRVDVDADFDRLMSVEHGMENILDNIQSIVE